MKFQDYKISDSIKKSLQELDFKRPTDIQFKAITPILKGEDVLAIAQTGTGKTAAFVIPSIEKILQAKKKNNKAFIRCLVLVPTRELAVQITDVYEKIGKHSKISVACLFGGVEQEKQIQKLTDGTDVLVTTPGRMFDLIHQGFVDLSHLKMLVLDEADLMLDMGFYKDVTDTLKHIPQKRQTLFFSATIDKKIKKLAYSVVKNAIRIQISPKNPVAKTIDHAVVFVEMDDKRFFLENILKEYEDKKFVVFVRTKIRAERVVAAMERVDLKAIFLHGGIEQKERFKILEAFRDGKERVLVTTDVAARGIDIPNVEYVINYDLPDNPENYVHRVGRTGRGNNRGQALSFCSESENPLLEAIEDYTGETILHYDVSPDDYEQILLDTEDGSNDWKKLMKEFDTDIWEDK
ncbi:MAG TPA: DEAD/DEAH box helicase [Crocinitomicaceae bacterium]|nr:DEAD/DEAH box helicase [Crocinitomicaceae bacterium]